MTPECFADDVEELRDELESSEMELKESRLRCDEYAARLRECNSENERLRENNASLGIYLDDARKQRDDLESVAAHRLSMMELYAAERNSLRCRLEEFGGLTIDEAHEFYRVELNKSQKIRDLETKVERLREERDDHKRSEEFAYHMLVKAEAEVERLREERDDD